MNTHRRWRQPLTKHLDLVLEHFDRFLRSKGSVNHFSKFDPDLMEDCLSVIRSIGQFNVRYKNWITVNTRNPQRFLNDMKIA